MPGDRTAEQAPLPANEAERLQAFSRYEFIVDIPNPVLAEIAAVAKDMFNVFNAGVSLLGKDEVLMLTARPDLPNRRPRADSYSGWVVLGDEILVVENVEEDPRFVAHFATPERARFFAGVPLTVSPGVRIGTFYVMDMKPREFSETDRLQLRRLSNLAMSELNRQRNQLDLHQRELMLSQASRLAKLGCFELNHRFDSSNWSDQMYEILDQPREAGPLSADEFLARVAPGDQARVAENLAHVLERPEPMYFEVIRPNGESRWLKAMAEVNAHDEVPGVFGCMQDVTELHNSHAEVQRLAFRDSLTGLPNRTQFNNQFQAAIDQARDAGSKVGLIMLDLDHFKDVNDTLGHDAGDALLVSVAERLTRCYRGADTVARLGGDEFAIILPDITGPDDMVRPTLALMELLRHPVKHGGQVFTISASVGGAIYPSDDEDAGQLQKNADIALYEAKAGGRNRLVTFEPAMRTAVVKRIETLRQVRQGAAADEFVLYYQPVVSIAPAAVTGLEALMRWNHPTRGVLTPDHFHEAFEDPDLSMLLFDVTFDSALKQMRAWLEQGVDFGRVALNVSAAQFRNAQLAAQIEAKLKHWAVPPERLTIEVTENVYMGWGADVVGDTVRRLHDSGVMIALDDFGTGYASLTNLKQFPIDRLKIDKSFVQNVDDQAIVQAVINLGSSLGMKVVAEGVEESDQLDFLARSGCDQVQGYHFARPMPGREVASFLARFGGADQAVA